MRWNATTSSIKTSTKTCMTSLFQSSDLPDQYNKFLQHLVFIASYIFPWVFLSILSESFQQTGVGVQRCSAKQKKQYLVERGGKWFSIIRYSTFPDLNSSCEDQVNSVCSSTWLCCELLDHAERSNSLLVVVTRQQPTQLTVPALTLPRLTNTSTPICPALF